MLLYIYLFVFFAGLGFFDYVRTAKINRLLFVYAGAIFSFIIFWALGSLRWKTGTDWDSYYDTVTMYSDIYRILYEPGYGLLLTILTSFTQNFTVYLIILTFLCLILKFNFFLKYHKETFFTVVLLYLCYYFADIFAVRQNLAISLTVFSTIFIIKRKPLLFAITVAIAASIHVTTALFFFGYYIYWAKITDKYFYAAIIFAILFGLSGLDQKILNLALKGFGLSGRIGDKIQSYLNGEMDTGVSDSILAYMLGLVKRCIFIPIFTIVKNRLKSSEPQIQGYFNLCMFGNILYFMFAKDLPVFARASVPFLFFEIFLVCYTVNMFRRSQKLIIAVYTLMVLVALSRYTALINSYRELYVPYYSIFDDKFKGR